MENLRRSEKCLNDVSKNPGRSQRISKYPKKSREDGIFSDICEVWVFVTSAQRYGDCFPSRTQNAAILDFVAFTDHIADYRSLFVAIGISAKLQFRYGGAPRSKVLAFTRYTTMYPHRPFILLSHTNAHTRALSSIQVAYFPPRRARTHASSSIERARQSRAFTDSLVFAISQK